MQKVKIKRSHASGLSLALAVLIICFVIYLLTLAAKTDTIEKYASSDPVNQQKRITEEVCLIGGDFYIVHLGACDTEEEARILAARYMQMGAAGYLYKSDRIYAAGNAYSNKSEANEAAERIRLQNIGAGVIHIKSEDAVLRITAAESQIEAFKSAYSAYQTLEDELFLIAQRLDAGLSASNALTQIAIAAYEFTPLKEDMESAVSGSSDAICLQISELCRTAHSEMRKLSKSKLSEMYLAASIRHTAIDLRLMRLNCLNGIRQGN
ncbi:MAG: hypothetical protein IJC48_12320 [Clostridia bacterium]|nr:hypothetical protein [Clostridia bacterium]